MHTKFSDKMAPLKIFNEMIVFLEVFQKYRLFYNVFNEVLYKCQASNIF